RPTQALNVDLLARERILAAVVFQGRDRRQREEFVILQHRERRYQQRRPEEQVEQVAQPIGRRHQSDEEQEVEQRLEEVPGERPCRRDAEARQVRQGNGQRETKQAERDRSTIEPRETQLIEDGRKRQGEAEDDDDLVELGAVDVRVGDQVGGSND